MSAGTAERQTFRPGQLTALIDGLLRFLQESRPPRSWPRWQARAERAQARADSHKIFATRALRAEERAWLALQETDPVLRGLPAWLAASVTVLLMCAGQFTLHAILAVADVPPRESWLLPAAFGPVFVMSTKIFVSWWLGKAERRPRAGQAMARLLIPALLLAFVAAVVGVAVKSMVIGTLAPLGDGNAMFSSAVTFGSVVLMEGVGAAALAAHQYAPGARKFEWVCGQYHRANRHAGRALRRWKKAYTVARSRTEWMAGRQEWAAGRAAMGIAHGWYQASKQVEDGDLFLDRVSAEVLLLPTAPTGFVPNPSPGQPAPVRRYGSEPTSLYVDAEFRRLLGGRNHHNRQDPLW